MKAQLAVALLVSVLVGVLEAASANADSIYTGAWSHHMGDKTERTETFVVSIDNETHYLLAYERAGYVIGGFKNSFGEPTAIAGKRFQLFESGDIEAGVYIGASYGYYSCTREIDEKQTPNLCPAVVPEISYTKYRLQPTFMLLGDAFTFSLKWDI
jgi:hypothetical protein